MFRLVAGKNKKSTHTPRGAASELDFKQRAARAYTCSHTDDESSRSFPSTCSLPDITNSLPAENSVRSDHSEVLPASHFLLTWETYIEAYSKSLYGKFPPFLPLSFFQARRLMQSAFIGRKDNSSVSLSALPSWEREFRSSADATETCFGGSHWRHNSIIEGHHWPCTGTSSQEDHCLRAFGSWMSYYSLIISKAPLKSI